MLLGYNTNGFAHHDPLTAIDLLADLGYRSVALTVDHGLLSPREDWRPQLDRIRQALARHDMRCVIETGARYLLNPRVKHEPTLVSANAGERAERRRFYEHCILLAAELEADCVSLWSGVVRDESTISVEAASVWDRLTIELEQTLDDAAARGVIIGFEPEPGMFIDTMSQFAELTKRLPHPALQLTLDVGHLHCLGETPITEVIERWKARIVNVHIEDMRSGVHEHLRFGDGEMDFPPILQAFAKGSYAGGVHVELSRHSHAAPETAAASMAFLAPLVQATTQAEPSPQLKPEASG
ncbi:MAG: sugar phosphate isomerase/epimerase [Pirellulales bacterium]|nr:sugar phosphate isomerase/epimerase [Pirellulales bacterium]